MQANTVERSWLRGMNWLLQTDLMISIMAAEIQLEAQLNEVYDDQFSFDPSDDQGGKIGDE